MDGRPFGSIGFMVIPPFFDNVVTEDKTSKEADRRTGGTCDDKPGCAYGGRAGDHKDALASRWDDSSTF